MSQKSIKIATGLFVYNRPEHTRQVLEHLRAAGCKELYIFCDGPKSGNMTPSIVACRELVQKIDWCVTNITMHSNNLGTVGNIIQGTDIMLLNNDAVIILEDDCVVKQDFFVFMNACLNRYKDDENIYHISGYQFPIKIERNPIYDAYYSLLPLSWGFGLWKRSWKKFRMDVSDAPEFFKSKESRKIRSIEPTLEYGIYRINAGKMNSFVYRWEFLINKNKGFCISPYKTFIRNIGCDGTGVHCKTTKKSGVIDEYWSRPVLSNNRDLKLPLQIYEDDYMNQQSKKFFQKPWYVELAKKFIIKTNLLTKIKKDIIKQQ